MPVSKFLPIEADCGLFHLIFQNRVSLPFWPRTMELFTKKRWIALPVLLVLLFVANLSLGSVRIPWLDVVAILVGKGSSNTVWTDIIWDFRMTKALTCILAGSALAIAGLQMQTLFRNALAGPDVLGLSSGASLLVSLLLMSQASGLAFRFSASPWAVAAAASLGSSLVFLLIVAISQPSPRQHIAPDYWLDDWRRHLLYRKRSAISE